MSEQKVQAIYKVTENEIYGFFKEHRFLSNFHVADIAYEGLIYTSTEAAYQAAKIYYPKSRWRTNVERWFFTVMTPKEAQQKGQLVKKRADWEEVKEGIMLDINRIKYNTHADVRELLLATGDKYLEETNWWKDRTWGVYNGEGKNWLGKILMKIRTELINYDTTKD